MAGTNREDVMEELAAASRILLSLQRSVEREQKQRMKEELKRAQIIRVLTDCLLRMLSVLTVEVPMDPHDDFHSHADEELYPSATGLAVEHISEIAPTAPTSDLVDADMNNEGFCATDFSSDGEIVHLPSSSQHGM